MLQPDVQPSFESLLGASWFAIFDQFMTYRKEQIPIAALIGKYLSSLRKLDHVIVLKAGFETQL
jgi:hypothetical protein